ncbi:beta-carotene isomerase D27, chloroplastic-like [Rutidosis leptorrhynchoides]|uniref:beta-carotene isomerase D27, chloroplastic-like n=1 Tax=Rutidosis leptorrhynchoides TaxID=125765 RepID=UPI003A9A0176
MGRTITLAQAPILSFLSSSHHKKPRAIKNGPLVLCVHNQPTSNHDQTLKFDRRDNNIATESKTIYHDNWLENIAISYITKTIADTAGIKNDVKGYKGLVMVSEEMFQKFSPIESRQIVIKALESIIPPFSLHMIRELTPQSKFTREFFAIITTLAFGWLVGPGEVRESELEGRKERNVVHITKCRFLEESNCLGMCTNLCKMPTQDFFRKNFKTPINMVPKFDDMSCEMIFGQHPPAQEDDPAFKQPCYKLCNVKRRHSEICVR